jgi:hypothetical protein
MKLEKNLRWLPIETGQEKGGMSIVTPLELLGG